MSYKTDRYAHKTKSTFVCWPELYNSQCDVDFKYTLLTTTGQYAATHFTVCPTTTDESVTVCGLLLAAVSVFPRKSKMSHFNGGITTSKTNCFKVKIKKKQKKLWVGTKTKKREK